MPGHNLRSRWGLGIVDYKRAKTATFEENRMGTPNRKNNNAKPKNNTKGGKKKVKGDKDPHQSEHENGTIVPSTSTDHL